MTAATATSLTFTDAELVAAVHATGARHGWDDAQLRRVTAGLRVLRMLAIAGTTITYGQYAELVQPEPLLAYAATGHQLDFARDVCLDHGRLTLGSLVVSQATSECSYGWESDGLTPAEARAQAWAAYGARRTPAL